MLTFKARLSSTDYRKLLINGLFYRAKKYTNRFQQAELWNQTVNLFEKLKYWVFWNCAIIISNLDILLTELVFFAL